MTFPKDLIRENSGIGRWCILHSYRGSIAHGMYMPSNLPNSIDDKDTMAVCIPPIDYYFGLKTFGSKGTKEIKRGEWDIVIYEAKKMVSLLSKGNPNVLSILWTEDKNIIKKTDAGQLLIDNKNLFVGKHVYKSFTGYAYSQLKKMTACAFDGYMGDKRKRLVEQYGYDTKNAAHLIRLLRMSIEFMTDGFLQVERHDAAQLLSIKRGEWELSRVKEESDRLFKLADEAYIRSKLPSHPDKNAIDVLLIDMIQLHYSYNS